MNEQATSEPQETPQTARPLLSGELESVIAEEEALRRYASGERPTFSTGICGSLTCGYGKLSEYGYWEFPLYPAEDYLPSNEQS